MEEVKRFEIFDRFNYKWTCSILKNNTYRNAPSFLRVQCRHVHYDRIMETENDSNTLLRILRYITRYHDALQFESHQTDHLMDVSPTE